MPDNTSAWATKLLAFVVVLAMVISGFMLLPVASAKNGGPDSVGYSFKDSDEVDGPTYSWIDATGGTALYSGYADDTIAYIDLPFNFEFYEEDFDSIWVNPNGLAGMGDSGSTAYVNRNLPGSGVGNVIAPYWDDMSVYTSRNQNVYWTTGTDGTHGDYLVVEWYNANLPYYYYFYSGYQVTFEVVWYADGTLLFQYLDSTSNYGYYSRGGSATVGIENGDQSVGLVYSYNSYNALKDSLAIEWTPPIPPVHDLRIKTPFVPDPLSLADENEMAVEVVNKGSTEEFNVDVSMEVFTTTVETVLTEDFSSGDPADWTHGIYSGTRDGWGTGIDEDYYNRGKDGSARDGEAMSAGRKGSGTSYPGRLDLAGLLYDGPYDVHAANDKLYVANYYGGAYGYGNVVVTNADGSNAHKLEDYPGANSYRYRPRSVTADSDGNVYFTTYGSSYGRLYKYSYNSGTDTYTYAWYKQHSGSQTLYYPMGVAYDEVNGEVLVSAGYFSSPYMYVSRWDPSDGSFEGRWRSYLGAPCYTSCQPMGIDTATVSGSTHVFIAYYSYSSGSRAGRVVEFDTSGSALNTYYGPAGGGGSPYGSTYKDRYFYDVASDGTNIYFGPYYYFYGGLYKAPIGNPSGVGTAITYSQLIGHNYYKYGIAVDDDYYYLATNYYDTVEAFEKSTGNWVKSMGAMAYDSWMEMESLDMSDAVGGTLTFDHSYGFYYLYEGAYLEASVDGGSSWEQVTEFNKGGYYPQPMATTYNNPYGGMNGWTYYSFGNSQDMYRRTTGDPPYDYKWQGVEVDLTDYAGYDDVRMRWRVAYSTYWYFYYNGWYRLDNVQVDLIKKDLVAMDETQTISSLAYKETITLEYSPFQPSTKGLSVGDVVGVLITIVDDYGDEDLSNNRWTKFIEVKYIVYSESFEGTSPLLAWDTSYSTGSGSNIWDVTDTKVHSGNYALFSGKKGDQGYPGSTAAATPTLDLSVAVEATLTYWHAFMFYYRYDGLVVEASTDDGATWTEIAPSDRGNGQPGYPAGYEGEIYNYAYYQNPLRGHKGWTYYDTDHGYPFSPTWQQVSYDLTPFVGNAEVKVRWQVGWASYYYYYYAPYGYWLDDLVITGVVFNDNVAITSLDVVDPIPVDGTPDIEARILNAGVNDQVAGVAKAKITIGPLGTQTVSPSEWDHESYTSTGDHPWTSSYTTSGPSWSSIPAWTFPTDDASSGTKAWGPDPGTGEFGMYYRGGEGMLVTDPVDLTTAPSDSVMTMTHRYNWVYYASQYYSYDGGLVEISTDDGATWQDIAPVGGYPGTIYNYAGYGNPLYGRAGFTHTSGGSTEWPNGAWLDSTFEMADYLGETVRFRFHFGMYNWFYPGDGELWYIDDVTVTGTGMESVVYSDIVDVSGSGPGGAFESAEAKDLTWNYHFDTPGEYKILVESWLDGYVDGLDDYEEDNARSVNRETMFTVSWSDAEEEEIGNTDVYTSGWSTQLDSGMVEWITTTAESHPDNPTHAWSVGDDEYDYPNGDDSSLISPVFDLSQSASAKMVFQHKYAFYANPPYYFYDGGRVEITTDGGSTWSALTPTIGHLYSGTVYSYAGYGNPLAGQQAFVGSQPEWVKTQIRLDAYTGPGMDTLQVRFHLGGAYPNWDPQWFIDMIGIYALGFDLKQTSAELPYHLEVGEGTTITTAFKNVGLGDLSPTGTIPRADVYAWVEDLDGNTVWGSTPGLMDGTILNNLPMATETSLIQIDFPGLGTPGLYTVGVKVAEAGTTDTLADLFKTNNLASHMLVVGAEQSMGTPMLTGSGNWQDVADEPAEVGDGAQSLTWDETDIPTTTLDIDILGQSGGFDPAAPVIVAGTEVTWTNTDTITHAVSDRNGEFDSGDILPGESWSMTFNTTYLGTVSYYCRYHTNMEGTIDVIAAAEINEKLRTPYVNIWSKDTYLLFWANFDMGEGDDVTVYAQKQGTNFGDAIALWGAEKYAIFDGRDHEKVGDQLTGSTDGEWVPYYIHLDSSKHGRGMEYFIDSEGDGNPYSFVFNVKGVIGTAAIGGVKVIRTLDYGFFLEKSDINTRNYEVLPTDVISIDYYVRNIGTLPDTLEITPDLTPEKSKSVMSRWTITAAAYDLTTDNTLAATADNGTFGWTIEGDHAVRLTITVTVPVYDPNIGSDYNEDGIPDGDPEVDNYHLKLHPVDVLGSSWRSDWEPSNPSFTIRTPNFALVAFTDPGTGKTVKMSFDRAAVLTSSGNVDTSLTLRVEAESDGYAKKVHVAFYVADPEGEAHLWTGISDTFIRATRVGYTEIPLMEPKQILEANGEKSSYTATTVWEEPSLPSGSTGKWSEVKFYAAINEPQTIDEEAGYKAIDEFNNYKKDNAASNSAKVVEQGMSTPSFAVGLLGLALAALLGGVAITLRRREEDE